MKSTIGCANRPNEETRNNPHGIITFKNLLRQRAPQPCTIPFIFTAISQIQYQNIRIIPCIGLPKSWWGMKKERARNITPALLSQPLTNCLSCCWQVRWMRFSYTSVPSVTLTIPPGWAGKKSARLADTAGHFIFTQSKMNDPGAMPPGNPFGIKICSAFKIQL